MVVRWKECVCSGEEGVCIVVRWRECVCSGERRECVYSGDV